MNYSVYGRMYYGDCNLGLLIGALVGNRAAMKRNGNVQDRLLYATVYGIIFALVGLFLAIAYVWFAS